MRWDQWMSVRTSWTGSSGWGPMGRVWLLATVVGLACGTGCDWREFDKLEDDAPVRAVGAPDGLDGYSASAVALRRPGDANYRQNTVVVAGFGPEAVVAVSVRSNGRASRPSGGDSFDTENEPSEVSSVVQLEASTANPEPTVLIGSAEGNRIHVVRLPEGSHFVNELTIDGPTAWEGFGGAVGTGDLGDVGGLGGGEEWIVASDNAIYVLYGEPKAAGQYIRCSAVCGGASCEAFRSATRAVVTGAFFDDLPAGTHAAVVGTPDEGRGRVHFLRWVEGATAPNGCPGSNELHKWVLEAPDASPAPSEMFGTSLFAVDLDGDSRQDLLVGAPDLNRVYVYLNESGDATGWENAAPDGIIEPPDPDNAVAFGSSMTFLDVDGDGTRELAVGDPEAYVGGKRGAGRVHLFTLNVAGGQVTGSEAATAYDLQPESTGGLGIAVSSVVMGDTVWSPGLPEELVVVSYKEVFIFFLTGMEQDHDPR